MKIYINKFELQNDTIKEYKRLAISYIIDNANNIVASKYNAIKQRKSMTIILKILAKIVIDKQEITEKELAIYNEIKAVDEWITNIRSQENKFINEINELKTIEEVKNYEYEFITD